MNEVKRIETDTLEEAYSKASEIFNCSITELEVDIIQHPTAGFIGMFKKSCIIEAKRKDGVAQNKRFKKSKPYKTKEPIANIDEVIDEIRVSVVKLIESSCFEIDKIEVSKYNDVTVLIELNGEDAALLIGKEGYRYKALSYLLYNWISLKYGLNTRLEIAEFLQNQEENVKKYLEGVKARIVENGRAQTKTLDGVLIKIALEELRSEYPEKYVGIKSARDGSGKYIVVNDFNRRQ